MGKAKLFNDISCNRDGRRFVNMFTSFVYINNFKINVIKILNIQKNWKNEICLKNNLRTNSLQKTITGTYLKKIILVCY